MKKIICENVPNTAPGSKDPASAFIETPKAEPDEEASATDPLFATAPLMRSDDYQKRFLAEYRQLKIRYERLKRFTTWIEAADISSAVTAPKHDCPCDLLREQQESMDRYLHILELRAVIERIDLEADDNA